MTARGDRDLLVLGRGRFVLGGDAQQTDRLGTTRNVPCTLYLVPTGSLHAVLQYRRRWLLASELTNHSLDLLVTVDALLAGSIMGNQGIDRCSCLPLCMRKFLRIPILSIIVRRIICRRGLHHVCPSVCAPGEGRFPDARAFPAISKSDLTVGTLASLDFGV